jgi:protein-disulfide isomerase
MKPALILAIVMVAFFVGGFFTAFAVSGAKIGAATGASGSGSAAAAAPAPPPAVVPSATGDAAAPSGPTIAGLLDDDDAIGQASAPVVIVEFSDYQCPFCRRFWAQTYSQIKKDYIDTGKVKLIFRDFPLSSIHPAAQKSGEAAECAGEQGKYYEAHDKLFEKQQLQGSGTVDYSVDDMKTWLAEISGIDAAKLNSCLDSGKYASEVEADFNAGVAAGVSGTPSFFVGKVGGTAQNLVGAQPFSAFKSAIDALLA